MKKIFLTIVAAAMMATAIQAQEKSKEQLHSAMLYNFTKYIQWPNESSSGEFVIGVLGNDKVYEILQSWNGKMKGAKSYVIKKLSSASEAAMCDVVYLGSDKSRDFDTLHSTVKGKSVLTVTDGSGLANKGSCINFKIVDGRLKFEMNQNELTSANLKVSGQLSSMAILI